MTNAKIKTVEFNDCLNGVVLTLDNGKTAQCQFNKLDNVLHADHGEDYLDRYDEYDSADLTVEENELIDDWANEHKWASRSDFH